MIYRLEPIQSTILKVSSVIGVEFSKTMLAALLPNVEKAQLDKQIAQLEGLNFIKELEKEDKDLLTFTHSTIQEVIFKMFWDSVVLQIDLLGIIQRDVIFSKKSFA